MPPATARFTSNMLYEYLESHTGKARGDADTPGTPEYAGINALKEDNGDVVATVSHGARTVRPAADASGL